MTSMMIKKNFGPAANENKLERIHDSSANPLKTVLLRSGYRQQFLR